MMAVPISFSSLTDKFGLTTTGRPYMSQYCTYIPDNQFRSRDPKFSEQKEKYGKRHQTGKRKSNNLIPADDFNFDQNSMTCTA